MIIFLMYHINQLIMSALMHPTISTPIISTLQWILKTLQIVVLPQVMILSH
ncbi:unnamed protein product [Schistosoma margrebowiei]|uniref:Uncharacterized protein n=1 Tax=Schistosoma margrebowiei TaxID=48269 RepID=A0A183MDN6_9TREM|nr:unnamed protein product [Schistosoma margrebowiei]